MTTSPGAGGHTYDSAPLLWNTLRTLADSVAIMIVYLGEDQRYRFTNRAHDDWCGVPRGTLDGRHMREVVGEELYAAVRPHVETVLGGQPTTFEVATRNREGRASFLQATYVPRFGDDGAVRGFLSVSVDITAGRQAETALRAIMDGTARATGEAFFPTLVRELAGVLEVRGAFVSESGTGSTTARALALWMGGRPSEPFEYDVTGTPCEAVVAGGTVAFYPDRLQERFPHDRWLAEVGAESYLAIPFFDSVGRMIGHMGILDHRPMDDDEHKTSILQVFAARVAAEVERLRTERTLRERDEQLRQAQKMEALGRFASGIAHDLSNILGAIRGFAELVLPSVPAGGVDHANLVEVLRASDRGKSFVEDVLVFGHPDDGERTRVRLGAVIDELVGLVRASLPATITLRTRVAEGTGDVLADPNQVGRVILNLCVNAGHALRERGGVLEVTLDEVEGGPDRQPVVGIVQPGRHVRLSIRDNGPGISSDVLPYVFEPFFTTKTGGSGLGLALVERIVTAHGGAIMVESEPGRGATFEVLLPRAAPAVEPPPEDSPGRRGSGRILLVEDDEAFARMSARTLEATGYQVVVRGTGTEALEVFAAAPRDFVAVVTDYGMPGMTGTTLATRLLGIRPDLPIVLYTGVRDGLTPEIARALGVREYLAKPASRRDLAEALARATRDPSRSR